ncbi:hypothetical protein WJX84_001224 [Apatococcus fuscideae]|uniref:Uncharacterized protein n=1 Tax=Apatococcus fuscideae TaxID=2026836 RepID=A0AAW1SR92_9CHLO
MRHHAGRSCSRTLSALYFGLLATCTLPESFAAEPAASVVPPAQPVEEKLTLDDLVVTFGTNAQDEHIGLARATRAWRKGVRAVISQNQEVPDDLKEEGGRYQETYLHYPDRGPEAAGFSQYPGDARAALAPFLAARHVGLDNFKWIMFGDDDTIWFWEGMLRLLEPFDHNTPYIITDGAYWHNWGRPAAPNFDEDGPPRCLPCHFNQTAYEAKPGALFTPPIGCPCTPQLLCANDHRGILDQYCAFPAVMNDPMAGPIYSVDGGAGAIMSVGLFKALDFDAVENCITTSHGSAGDHIFSYCMWNMGVAMTLPNTQAMPTSDAASRMFSPGDTDAIFHNDNKRFDIMARLIWAAEGSPACDAVCEHQLMSLVSAHIKSRNVSSKTCLMVAVILKQVFMQSGAHKSAVGDTDF